MKAEQDNKKIFYLGTKSFGYNINWLARLKQEDRIKKTNKITNFDLKNENNLFLKVPKKNYISLMSQISKNNYVDLVDENGFLISTNLANLTKNGAIYLGRKSVFHSAYGEAINSLINSKNER